MDTKKTFIAAGAPAALAAAGLAVYARFVSELPAYTVFEHVFRPSIPALLSAGAVIGLTLFAFQALYAQAVSRLARAPFEEVIRRDSWSLLPFAATALAPVTLNRYIGAADAAVRSHLLLGAAAALVIYLKVAAFRAWRRRASGPLRPLLPAVSGLSSHKKLGLLALAALIVFNLGAAIMLGEGAGFSGDEPHYLLMTHSLLRDGDLDLANNYRNKDYRTYMAETVTIPQLHVIRGRKPGSQYSFHSPGTAFVMFPFYAAGSLLGKTELILLVKFGMSLFGALFGLQVFLYARDAWKNERLALALWAVVTLATPVYFYAVHVYPELIVGALAFLVFRTFRMPGRLTGKRLLVCGFLASTFIWFHALKYIFLAGPLIAYGLWKLGRKRTRVGDFVLFLAFPIVVTAAYLVFQKTLYGSYSLSAVSWKGSLGAGETLAYAKELLTGIPFRFRWETLAGYFFDQKDGLFLYAPIYLCAALGLVEMIRRKVAELPALVFVAAPYVLVSAFLTQRTGYAPQARPLVAVVWAMVIGIGWFMAGNGKRLFSGMFAFASLYSLGMTGLLLLNPLCLYQETTMGTAETGGGIFYVLSNLHMRLTEWLPAYAKSREGPWPPNVIWLGLFALFVALYAVGRRERADKPSPRRTRAVFVLAGGIVFFVGFVLYPRTVLYAPQRTAFPGGESLTFYSMSRAARQPEPGLFLLPDGGRDYVFTFSSTQKLARLGLEFGSETADGLMVLEYFDAPVFKGMTARETHSIALNNPPAYAYHGEWLYFLTVKMGELRTGVSAATPFLFRLKAENPPKPPPLGRGEQGRRRLNPSAASQSKCRCSGAGI
jgi:hypothetical protein